MTGDVKTVLGSSLLLEDFVVTGLDSNPGPLDSIILDFSSALFEKRLVGF